MGEASHVEQPIGPLVEAKEAGVPGSTYEGEYVTLEQMTPAHFGAIWKQIQGDDHLWTYMLEEPYQTEEAFAQGMTKKNATPDFFSYTIIDKPTGSCVGTLALWRRDAVHRSIEVGHVLLSKALQRTRGATEAFYLLIKAAFDLHFRRVEWKCNELNAPSKRAAERLGFTFEGIFRQHFIIKGHNRDSAWYSMLDGEWPVAQKAFCAWLDAANFDENGVQRQGLVALREEIAARQAKA